MLSDLPIKTPVWAIGIVTIIVAIAFAAISFYSTIKYEVQDYIKEQSKVEDNNHALQQQTVSSILNMFESNQKQILSLTDSLREAQSVLDKNSIEIETIKTELRRTKIDLDDCEHRLNYKVK